MGKKRKAKTEDVHVDDTVTMVIEDGQPVLMLTTDWNLDRAMEKIRLSHNRWGRTIEIDDEPLTTDGKWSTYRIWVNVGGY